MHYELTNLDAEHWNSLVERAPQVSLLQCWEYGAAKAALSSWAIERGIIHNGPERVAAVQVQIRRLPLGVGGFAWINRAPLILDKSIAPHTAIEILAKYYARERGYYVRIAAPIPVDEQPDIGTRSSEYRLTAATGWASAKLDLGRSEDDLRKSLRGNWRNSLRKAEKSDIEVVFGSDAKLFDDAIALYGSFLAGKNFSTTVTPDFLRRLQSMLPEERKLIVYSARKAGELLSTVIIARYGTSCEYLAGASNERSAGMGLGQLLLWRAIVESKYQGRTTFDLGGMEPNVTPKGIYDFKAGVSPAPYRLMNEIEAGYRNPLQRLMRWYISRARGSNS